MCVRSTVGGEVHHECGQKFLQELIPIESRSEYTWMGEKQSGWVRDDWGKMFLQELISI